MQHPDEVKNAKGTAIIAKLYLKSCQVLTGEDFSRHKELEALIDQSAEDTFVVFPHEYSQTLNEYFDPDSAQVLGLGRKYNLIFIDGSWRKAKKIWHSTPCLQRLRCINISKHKLSNYRIRKAPKDGYISTIEAIVACLEYLDSGHEKYKPLLQVFDKMIDAQIDSMGDKIFKKNYS